MINAVRCGVVRCGVCACGTLGDGKRMRGACYSPAEVAFLVHCDEKLVKLIKDIHLAEHPTRHIHLPRETIGVERHCAWGGNLHSVDDKSLHLAEEASLDRCSEFQR
jgi:hypothetical protein